MKWITFIGPNTYEKVSSTPTPAVVMMIIYVTFVGNVTQKP